MMRTSSLLALATLVALSGCAATGPPTEGTRKVAAEAFLYAQMAANTYRKHDNFKLPDSVKSEHFPNDPTGFAYSIYRIKAPAGDRLVMAFRGTETELDAVFQDWIFGNILTQQQARGLGEFIKLRDREPGVPIVLVGHSLGGAIAQHVALREKNVSAFVFNTSTRFTRGPHPQSNPITLISEYGEVNRVLDWPTIDPQSTTYIVSCSFGHPLRNHSQRALAACLTKIAAGTDAQAAWSVSENRDLGSIDELWIRRQERH